jgi:hypothetical protein
MTFFEQAAPRSGALSASCAEAEKKCAASPGGTFFILLAMLALSTQGLTVSPLTFASRPRDSKTPQVPILTGKLLEAGDGALAKACV